VCESPMVFTLFLSIICFSDSSMGKTQWWRKENYLGSQRAKQYTLKEEVGIVGLINFKALLIENLREYISEVSKCWEVHVYKK
jgi:hypothetical protein